MVWPAEDYQCQTSTSRATPTTTKTPTSTSTKLYRNCEPEEKFLVTLIGTQTRSSAFTVLFWRKQWWVHIIQKLLHRITLLLHYTKWSKVWKGFSVTTYTNLIPSHTVHVTVSFYISKFLHESKHSRELLRKIKLYKQLQHTAKPTWN